ncbi:MAG: alpha/beta hydrolase [Gammaproteobacteria bacterium]|nr:alpha/beta hydrolase [Gammaproteobacteria bacterium]
MSNARQRRYVLTPELADFVARTAAYSANEDNLAAQRAAYRRMCRAFTPERPADLVVTDLNLTDERRIVSVRRYLPSMPAPRGGWPCVLYLHGGGWVLGDLDTHDFMTAALAHTLQAAVIAVDYRLAPEHPFPAAFDDSLTAWRALQTNSAELGIDGRRVAVVGDSAGGNLAAALCLAVRETGGLTPCGQALIYPVLVGEPTLPARCEHVDAPMLSARDMANFIDLYLPDADCRRDPRAMPLAADRFDRLPPAFVAVAEFDLLCDDGVEYVRCLREAGVSSELYFGAGLVHGCMRARYFVPAVDQLYDALVAALNRFFAAIP